MASDCKDLPGAKGGGKPPRAPPKAVTSDGARLEQLLQLAAVGVRRDVAARVSGVDALTIRNWVVAGKTARTKRARGEPLTQADRDAIDVCANLAKARAQFEAGAVARISSAGGSGDWKADAWLLERLNPEVYATRSRVEMTGKRGGPIQTNTTVTLDELSAALATAVRNESPEPTEPDGHSVSGDTKH